MLERLDWERRARREVRFGQCILGFGGWWGCWVVGCAVLGVESKEQWPALLYVVFWKDRLDQSSEKSATVESGNTIECLLDGSQGEKWYGGRHGVIRCGWCENKEWQAIPPLFSCP